MPDQDERFDDDAPTFLLDVPVLNVDELDLEVENLRAHVSLRAELANLVKINVGVDVYLDNVKLNLQGVEAQALLTVKLDRVLGTLDRALEAINSNPQILNEAVQVVDSATGDAGQGADREAREGDEYVDERGQIVGRACDESGNVAEGEPDEEGNVENPGVSEEAGNLESEDDGEESVTDAARRKAGELGVKLSEVRGTGSGGRVLVKDVQRSAKQSAADQT